MTTRTMIVMAMLAAGCAGIPVQRDYDAAADFRRLKTYAWQPPVQSPETALADNSLIEDRVHRAVDADLTGRGYAKAGPAAPADFKVTYAYLVERQESSDRVRTGVGFGMGGGGTFGSIGLGMGSGRGRDEFETLSIDVLDAATGKLLWHGFTRRQLYRRSDPRKAEADMNALVKAILAKFPPDEKR